LTPAQVATIVALAAEPQPPTEDRMIGLEDLELEDDER
jgi:hypothetical protein